MEQYKHAKYWLQFIYYKDENVYIHRNDFDPLILTFLQLSNEKKKISTAFSYFKQHQYSHWDREQTPAWTDHYLI